MQANPKLYIITVSHNCSFKASTNGSVDVNKVAREWVADQNKGEAKSDRMRIINIQCVTQQYYDSCTLWDNPYCIKGLNKLNQ